MTGCAKPSVLLAPADGVVTFNGSPVAGATVMFVPDKGPVAVGFTNMEGKFSLSTAGARGVAVGNAKVTVTVNSPSDSEEQALQEQFSKRPTSPKEAQEYMKRANKAQEEMNAARRAEMAKSGPSRGQSTGGNSKDKPKPSMIPLKYSNAKTSGLSYPINANGDNHFKIQL